MENKTLALKKAFVYTHVRFTSLILPVFHCCFDLTARRFTLNLTATDYVK
jgi:hypothetical protein